MEDAWAILGKDSRILVAAIKSLPNLESRMEALKARLEEAKKLARTGMAKNHPDQNPGDISARTRFKAYQDALESVTWHTERTCEAMKDALENPSPLPVSKRLIVIG